MGLFPPFLAPEGRPHPASSQSDVPRIAVYSLLVRSFGYPPFILALTIANFCPDFVQSHLGSACRAAPPQVRFDLSFTALFELRSFFLLFLFSFSTAVQDFPYLLELSNSPLSVREPLAPYHVPFRPPSSSAAHEQEGSICLSVSPPPFVFSQSTSENPFPSTNLPHNFLLPSEIRCREFGLMAAYVSATLPVQSARHGLRYTSH